MSQTTRIVVASNDDKGLDGAVGAHFGRCPYFTVVEAEGEQISAVRIEENPFGRTHRPGQVPEHVHGLGADVILAGGMGHRAVSMFHRFGIDVATTGASGTIREVVEAYLGGRLSGTVPCRHDHPDSCGHH